MSPDEAPSKERGSAAGSPRRVAQGQFEAAQGAERARAGRGAAVERPDARTSAIRGADAADAGRRQFLRSGWIWAGRDRGWIAYKFAAARS